MGTSVSISDRKKQYVVFLNISLILCASCVFLFLPFHGQGQDPDQSSQWLKANKIQTTRQEKQGCKGLRGLSDKEAKCSYIKKATSPCVSQGYIDYLSLFYCRLGGLPLLGYSLLGLWLLILFYLLGNTASEYFCESLESLSKLFHLSPTIAGVTLLSLGNGAPDVFASLVSFTAGGDGGGEIGLNTVLGGDSVVSCVVVGVIAIALRKRRIRVDKAHFVRDVFFFLLVLLCLAVILVQKEIDIWGAITFFSIYVIYVVVVYVLHARSKIAGASDSAASGCRPDDHHTPLLLCIEKGEMSVVVEQQQQQGKLSSRCRTFFSVIETPLYLPRRLTIPVISEEKWSKFYAVASVALAPVLLSALGAHQVEAPSLAVLGAGLAFGACLGLAAYATTARSGPPSKFTFPWLGAGFLMSVTWSYIIAQELVGLLASLAYILGVDPSILGFTVLAWGNSVGDLVTNLTMALNGGPEGAQIAFSGCYAGPIFNTVFGLGLSLIGYCWSEYPSSVTVSRDPHLLQTLGFLAGGLFWALLVLPRRDMRLDVVFGGGLLVIYVVSLSLSLFQALGSSQLHHHNIHVY